jgi:hypothetical protein
LIHSALIHSALGVLLVTAVPPEHGWLWSTLAFSTHQVNRSNQLTIG